MRRAINRAMVQVLWMAAIGCALPALPCRAAETAAAPVLKIQDLGNGAVVLRTLSPGLSEDTPWEESRLQIQIQDQLVLYTGGLLEARNQQGGIFGFDRLAALLADRLSAEQALAAAQAFGQEDDITVLTLARPAVGEKATAELIARVLVPA